MYEKEDHQKPAIFPHLATTLSIGIMKIVNQDLTSLDGAILLTLMGDIHEMVALLLAEDKQEIGEGGSDPPIQAGLSMIRFWDQDNVRTLASQL